VAAADNDAVEATRHIRALASAAAQNSVVALTANVLTTQRDVYLAAGISGVTGKPISLMALVAEVARIAAPGEDDEEFSPERAARATSARSSARRAR
jgi:CheY-like chemotaxis protein